MLVAMGLSSWEYARVGLQRNCRRLYPAARGALTRVKLCHKGQIRLRQELGASGRGAGWDSQ